MRPYTRTVCSGGSTNPPPSTSRPKPPATSLVPSRQRVSLPISSSNVNTPNPTPTRRLQRSKADPPDIAAHRERERARRWLTYGSSVASFESSTDTSRAWHAQAQVNKEIWAKERARLALRIPALEAELKKAYQDKENMDAAEKKMMLEFGEIIEEGRRCQERLDEFTLFLGLEHDREPLELLDDGDLDEELAEVEEAQRELESELLGEL